MTEPLPTQQVPVATTTPPPPATDPVIVQVAQILLALYAIDKTISLLRTLLGAALSEQALRAALALAAHAHKARPQFAQNLIGRSAAEAPAREVIRTVADADIYYRAAYVTNAARRIQLDLDEGRTYREAMRREERHYQAHRRARQKRLDAAADVGVKSIMFGDLLGWYRNWALDSDLDCIAADGNNFSASQGTIIGLPGSVHPNCGCQAGPAHEDGGMVNEAVASLAPHRPLVQVRRRRAS